MEPTDRSIPPAMMTKVIPIASNALSATCLEMITILPMLRKFGAAIAKKVKTRIRATKVRMCKSSSSADVLDEDTPVTVLIVPEVSVLLIVFQPF
ncbi:hypothetical protein D3C87_1764740 [compost metagenome]